MAKRSQSNHSEKDDPSDDCDDPSTNKEMFRRATVYDAVAGKLGPNGFLSHEKVTSSQLPSGPEEYLLRRTNISSELLEKSYAAVEDAISSGKLPDSDMLKAVHAYASDFYSSALGQGKEKTNSQSLDETALIAVGILLEEAVREALGENGDMVFVEPDGLEQGLGESKMTKHQIKGRVKPSKPISGPSASDEDSVVEEASPAKRRRL
ncbi:uncharacterized protein A1O9_11466 [Exophiala aquamarina CBS 119918]|uniref:Uncharacterized protein n=1 Tax=Exophiala aquamarina CBS 119918 TaxID=1182545 RepID=A0A072P034_9EURO|nr:uncharacterized protein A1O9_11466 [Exophiala aquamarina CBS 119918]KEF52623.1 hypothetical protein A1O9_11466 [Exophiala aquamarina CBS 119918]